MKIIKHANSALLSAEMLFTLSSACTCHFPCVVVLCAEEFFRDAWSAQLNILFQFFERERERERDSACVWVLYIYIQTHFFPNNPRDGNLILSDPEVEGVTCWEKYYDYKELSISCNIYYRSNYKRLLPWIYILCTMNISTILQQWINIAFFKIINLKWFFMYLHVSKCL